MIMGNLVSLALHFIALIFLIGMVENLEESFERASGWNVPDWLGFFIIWGIAFFLVWVADWRFMSFLGYESVYPWGIWIEWGLSSLVIAAGSDKLQKKFDLINTIPNIVGNVTVARKTGKTKDQLDQDPNKSEYIIQEPVMSPPPIYDPNDPMI